MHQHKRVDATLSDEPGSNHRFSESRRGCKHARVVRQHSVGGLLLRPTLAGEAHVQAAT